MSQDFSWDKFLGKSDEAEQGSTDKPSVSGPGSPDLDEILRAIDASDERSQVGEPESGQTSDDATPSDLEQVQSVELTVADSEPMSANDKVESGSIEVVDPYRVAPLPRDLVEPEKTNAVFDADYRPEYAREKDIELLHFKQQAGEELLVGGVDATVANPTRDKEGSKYFVGEHLQTPKHQIAIDSKGIKDTHIDEVLRDALERKASDVHLTAGLPPMARVDGELVPLNYEILAPEHTKSLVYDIMTDEHIQKFESTHELDMAYTAKGLARYRMNVYVQRHSVAAALRMIPNRIPSYEDLSLPPVIREIAKRSSGLVLVTGPTGSGKSTTIAAMVDDINGTRQGHILTIEDPIEYLHNHKKSMINQREMHSDTYSFHNALRAVLREDPDVILVGELRDLETIEAALTLAETGHLVFGTLHTRNAPSTIDRVIDVFPSDQQSQIRVLLSNTLEGVISQQLLPKLGGGRCAALEIMIGIPAIKNLIREAKTHQMYSVIETNRQIGMQTLDSHLADMFKMGYVSYDECAMRAVDKETFAHLAKAA
ncbi:MAG: type IV pilus twitching motility protein PilT [Chthonomonadaceae bacterium]|nr:type IV pilus twitching motility protein PilT [Chthonomonadaceae bacterium]